MFVYLEPSRLCTRMLFLPISWGSGITFTNLVSSMPALPFVIFLVLVVQILHRAPSVSEYTASWAVWTNCTVTPYIFKFLWASRILMGTLIASEVAKKFMFFTMADLW